MKVYIVETEHSGIECVFDSLEKAEKHIAKYNDELTKCHETSYGYAYGLHMNDEWPVTRISWFEVE